MDTEHPYDAYTSCQLVSSKVIMSTTTVVFAALATSLRWPRTYKARDRGEVGESNSLEERKYSQAGNHLAGRATKRAVPTVARTATIARSATSRPMGS